MRQTLRVATVTAFAMSVVTTLAWAWTGGVEQIGLVPSGDPVMTAMPGASRSAAYRETPPARTAAPPMTLPADPDRADRLRPTVLSAAARPLRPGVPARAASGLGVAAGPRRAVVPGRAASGLGVAAGPRRAVVPGRAASGLGVAAGPRRAVVPARTASGLGVAAGPVRAGGPARTAPARKPCRTGRKLVPTCGVLWGVAPGARTEERGSPALADFERKTGRHQDIYHGYHHGIRQVFPTPQEIAIARQPGRKRILLLNWKPESTTWARIAKGDRRTDEFLDRMARHLRHNFREPFFFAIHHEAEDQVRERAGSGYTARDYAAMFRHVVERLRRHGADHLVTVLVHMAYVPHTTKSWFSDMYPGDDVVDWIGFDTYSYSDPGYGHGDFAELLNRRSARKPGWPGFYNWVRAHHPRKPLMVAEWGVWFSKRNPGHMAEFYREVGRQIGRFPAIKAMVHFETPANRKGQDSSVDSTPAALREYRRLGRLPVFQVVIG